MLTQLDQPSLGRGEGVLEYAGDDVRAAPVGPRARRTAAELLLEHAHQRVGDLHQEADTSLLLARAERLLFGGHSVPPLLLLRMQERSRWRSKDHKRCFHDTAGGRLDRCF